MKVPANGSMLIIDDETEIRESLETLLELDGYSVGPPTMAKRACEDGLSARSTSCCWISRCRTATASRF